MTTVYDYTDFRKYLADYYAAKKAANPRFSYKLLANKGNFRNKGFVYNIVNGAKMLSKANVLKLSQALGHNKHETEYFEYLVAFNQAKSLKERTYYFERCNNLRGRGVGMSKAQILRKDQYEFYSQWYHSAVRSLIDMHEFKDDYAWLARAVCPPISLKQARQSVRLLEDLGLIARGERGVYRLTSKSITTGPEVVSLGVTNFHIECTKLAARSIEEMPREKRNVTGLTLGISAPGYQRICEEIRTFQQKIMDIADQDANADRVYQLNFHLFPISDATTERKKP
jgi:uncharacterized protein (TIGR02147 family)